MHLLRKLSKCVSTHCLSKLVNHLSLFSGPEESWPLHPVPLHVQVVHHLHDDDDGDDGNNVQVVHHLHRPGHHHVRHHGQLSPLNVALDHHSEGLML